jgi:L-2-hydroxyglutarate oxidase LhgO
LDEVDAVVIGAGAVGLTIAPDFTRKNRDVFILERKFFIEHEEKRSYPSFIDLIAIEPPELTASPAIANMVSNLVNEILD